MVVAIFFSLVQLNGYHVFILNFFRKDYSFRERQNSSFFLNISKTDLTFF